MSRYTDTIYQEGTITLEHFCLHYRAEIDTDTSEYDDNGSSEAKLIDIHITDFEPISDKWEDLCQEMYDALKAIPSSDIVELVYDYEGCTDMAKYVHVMWDFSLKFEA
jgi:hypothetical protein